MRTLLTCSMALIVGLTASSLALAGGKGGSGGSGSKGSSQGHSSSGSSWYHGSSSVSHLHNTGGNTYSKSVSFSKNFNYHNYHLNYGKKFSKGYYYPGKYHNHWSYCCFNKKYGCCIYWCPCTFRWYYYCVPDCCYYPVCYVPYSCYCWGVPVSYSAAPAPPAEIAVPEPVTLVGPSE